MIIGTVRPEEAKVFDQDAGTHKVPCFPHDLEFEVYWSDGPGDEDEDADTTAEPKPGWYWSGTFGHGGPHSSSSRAKADAEEELEEGAQDDMERRAAQR